MPSTERPFGNIRAPHLRINVWPGPFSSVDLCWDRLKWTGKTSPQMQVPIRKINAPCEMSGKTGECWQLWGEGAPDQDRTRNDRDLDIQTELTLRKTKMDARESRKRCRFRHT